MQVIGISEKIKPRKFTIMCLKECVLISILYQYSEVLDSTTFHTKVSIYFSLDICSH